MENRLVVVEREVKQILNDIKEIKIQLRILSPHIDQNTPLKKEKKKEKNEVQICSIM